MNYYPDAIDIITARSGFTSDALIREVAKNNPHAVVRANESLKKRKNLQTWVEEVRPVAESGRKIEAIKLCRALTGFDLKKAKEAVEKVFNV